MTTHETPVALPPNADLVIKFTRPMHGRDVSEWVSRMEAEFPGRKIVAIDHTTEFHILSRSARTTNRLIVAAIAVLVIDLVVRAVA